MSVHEHPLITAQREAARKPRVTVARLFLRAVQRWQRSRAMAELQRLDDRQLKDIGMSRADIPMAVEGLFHRRDDASRTSSPPVSRHPADQLRKAA